ncbi:TraR/DksA family transcriptional regulator [Maridesulfovibrio sp. FT414]|uniref:TraR/DksA family transcriptional regulator n=1 Tax=Maridesulfovibrio sp. FT414 TaxID=2979469 RepID=UPI003D807FD8
MDNQKKTELENKIIIEIANLKQQVENIKDTVEPVAPDAAIGRLSRLDTMLNQGINKNSIARSKERILKLEGTLIRLRDDPFFGECEGCGEEINFARLLALPESRFCINCAE